MTFSLMYLWRHAISSIFGKVKSYRSNYQNREEEKAIAH